MRVPHGIQFSDQNIDISSMIIIFHEKPIFDKNGDAWFTSSYYIFVPASPLTCDENVLQQHVTAGDQKPKEILLFFF